jgi:hypothetical protein
MSNRIKFTVGPNIILSYKRLDYKIWYALAEYIDNSTQSYFANRKELDKAHEDRGEKFSVRISGDRKKTLSISDNAMGMSLEELTKALSLGVPPEDISGRSEYGLGLKTASCWLGDVWKLTTKKLNSLEEYEVIFDVNKMALGGDLEITTRKHPEAARNLSFTTIEISDLHKPVSSRTETKIKDYLTNIYRVDIRDKVMELVWSQIPLTYESHLVLFKGHDGTPYKQDIKEFEVNGKKITGWIGIYDEDHGGRNRAGLAIIRRGRCIVSQPEAWMPQGLYGEAYQGTNTLVSQRLVGEIYLNDFEVSHTKNAILFNRDEEEKIEEELEKQFSVFKKIAGTPYKKLKQNPAIQGLQKQQAGARMGSTAVRNAVLIEDVPTDKVVQDNKESTLADLSEVNPDLVLNYGDSLKVQIYTDVTKTSNDAYVIFEYPNAEIINVVVNNKHPYYQQAIGDDPVVNHLVSVATDALAEWKCMQRDGEIKPDTIRLLKDNILRAVTKAEN